METPEATEDLPGTESSRVTEMAEPGPSQRPGDRARGDVGTGISVVIRRKNSVLCGKRIGSHRAGYWCFPGGHVDFGNSWTEAAAREVMEETGLEIRRARVIAVTNNVMTEDGLQYTTVYMEAECSQGEPQALEPHKCERWEWASEDQIPMPHMTPRPDLERLGFKCEEGPPTEESLDFAKVDGAWRNIG